MGDDVLTWLLSPVEQTVGRASPQWPVFSLRFCPENRICQKHSYAYKIWPCASYLDKVSCGISFYGKQPHNCLMWTYLMSSCVSWCCSAIVGPPGLAQHALFLFPVHLLLLCVDRTTWCCCWLPDFGLSCKTMGQRTVWSGSTPELPGCALPLALQRQRLSSPPCTHGRTATLGRRSPSHTFKLLINVSLCLWPSSGPRGSQWGLCLCTDTHTHKSVSSHAARHLHT